MRWEVAERIVKDAERGDYYLYTSTITLAEVRRIREKREQLSQNEIAIVQAFFENEYIRLGCVDNCIKLGACQHLN